MSTYRTYAEALDLLDKLQEKLPTKSSYITDRISKLGDFVEKEKRECHMHK
jgi:hypothetical protein